MSDNRRRYKAVRSALNKFWPTEPKGNLARHLNTQAALISGIVGSKSTQLPKIAQKVPDRAKKESRTIRFTRWVKNERIEYEVYFAPFAQLLLAALAHTPLVLVMDGSEVGRGCNALMLGVVYKKRALPIAWIVIQGRKGHFPEETHVELLKRARNLVPQGSQVIFLGDGEFDGTTLQETLSDWDWEYVCRTAKNTVLFEEGEEFSFEKWGAQPGECLSTKVTFTRQAYGPVLAIAWWKQGYEDPIYLVSNMELAEEACYWYAKRFRIETLFSDTKSRGFGIDKSHLSDPVRLSRLMMAVSLAYIWMVFLGALAIQQDLVKIIHRPDRCDKSLFQLGLDLLEHFLNDELPILVTFKPWNQALLSKSVW